MDARHLTVAILLTLSAARASAAEARGVLEVRATVVRSIAVRSVVVAEAGRAGVVGARSSVATTVSGGAQDARPVEARTERIGADGAKEVLVTVWADGAPPAVTFRTGS